MASKKEDQNQNTEKREELEATTLEQAPILSIMLNARIDAKKSIAQLSKVLNIQMSYLRALEEGDTDSLPETVYTLGFVRSYANYLELDGEKCVKEYKQQILFADEDTQKIVMPSPPQVSPAPKRAMLLLSFILVVGGYMGWLYVSEKRENKTQLTSESKLAQAEIQESEKDESFFDISEPEVEDPFAFEDHPVDKKTAEAQKKRAIQIETSLQPDQNEAQVKNNQQTQTEGESGVEHANSDIVILVSQRSWIEIKDAESKILYRGILKEGETYPIPKGEGMIFTTGNAGGISFSIDGKKTPIMGRSGQVIRRVPLTKESLSAVGRPNESQRQATTGDDARATTRERNEGPTTRGITSTYPGY